MKYLQQRFEDIVEINNLVKAHHKAMLSKCRDFYANTVNYKFMSELLLLQTELINETYHPQPYRDRIIYEPKVRHIQAPAYRDRIVHHAINNILSPFYERLFIPDSYACRPGRGIHSAVAKVRHILRSATQTLFVCKIDISKYYPSVNHRRLLEILATHIPDEKIIYLLNTIISSSNSGTEFNYLFPPESYFLTKGPRGIPIGNLTSQLFANIYLHSFDLYAKKQLKIRRYVRYMDDILFFCESKQQLRAWQERSIDFLYENLYLTINPRKVRVYPSHIGVDFVGYVIFDDHVRLRSASVRRFKKRQRRQLTKLLRFKTSKAEVRQSFEAWQAHAMHADTKNLVKSLAAVQNDYFFLYDVKHHYRRQHRDGNKHAKSDQLSLFDLNDF